MTTEEVPKVPPQDPPFIWLLVFELHSKHHHQTMRRARLENGWLYLYESHAHHQDAPERISSGDSTMCYVPDR